MNLVFHISEDGSEIVINNGPKTLILIIGMERYKKYLFQNLTCGLEFV